MFEAPTDPSIREVIITDEAIRQSSAPLLVHHKEKMAG